jgi:hypothetical protein
MSRRNGTVVPFLRSGGGPPGRWPVTLGCPGGLLEPAAGFDLDELSQLVEVELGDAAAIEQDAQIGRWVEPVLSLVWRGIDGVAHGCASAGCPLSSADGGPSCDRELDGYLHIGWCRFSSSSTAAPIPPSQQASRVPVAQLTLPWRLQGQLSRSSNASGWWQPVGDTPWCALTDGVGSTQRLSERQR